MNAAAAIAAGGLVENLAEGVEHARESIDSGAALGALEKLVALSNA